MRALDTNKLKAEIIRQLEYLSEWTDNGECREYSDIDRERATEIADEIIKECAGDTQPDTGSGLHLADVNGSISAKAEMINALTNTLKANKKVLGSYHSLSYSAFNKLMGLIDSI